MKLIQGNEFYNSDEFKALCAKFDIPWEKLTTDLTIYISCEGFVKITQEYYLEKENNTNIAETTNLHNEEYKSPQIIETNP